MAVLTRKLVRLMRQQAAAERREAIQQEELKAQVAAQIVTPYSGRGILEDYYVQSFIDPELVVKVQVPRESLTKCLDASVPNAILRVGGQDTLPVGTVEADRKGFTNHYYRVKFVHYKATPTAKLTKWGTRVVTYYDVDGDQAFREIPMGGSIKQVKANFAAIIATPAPFTRGLIQLISSTGDVLESSKIA